MNMSRKYVALLFALPALLVPVIEIPLVLWARATFISLHPEYYIDPPTISRSINDPLVGRFFAQLILVITGLIVITLPMLTAAYLQAISRLKAGRVRRAGMYVNLLLVLVLQFIASTGMVMTTQYTFAVDRNMHMLGSYIFFIFQAVTILLAANLCRMLHGHKVKLGISDDDWEFPAVMHRFRIKFAMVIAGLAVTYGILFKVKDFKLPFDGYIIQVAYTQCEVIVIACFVLFIGSYAADIFHMVRHDKLRFRRGGGSSSR